VQIEDWYSFKEKVSFHDWLSYDYKDSLRELTAIEGLKVLNRILRSASKQKSETIKYWLSYLDWLFFHPYTGKFLRHSEVLTHKRAWSFLFSSIQQLKQYDAVITDRLHGHILCTILEIPNIFLPNSYHKNKAFYETWTHNIPFCRFVEDPKKVSDAVIELAELYPQGASHLEGV
jgi:pyruvyl transferase EpsO